MFEKLKNFINPKRCRKCRSTKLDHCYSWNGGWNHLCNQATGRKGTRCYDCGDMVWDQTDGEYKASLPKWCTMHGEELSSCIKLSLSEAT